jgi:hypothetical protein
MKPRRCAIQSGKLNSVRETLATWIVSAASADDGAPDSTAKPAATTQQRATDAGFI